MIISNKNQGRTPIGPLPSSQLQNQTRTQRHLAENQNQEQSTITKETRKVKIGKKGSMARSRLLTP
jgi:hypothetical protein